MSRTRIGTIIVALVLSMAFAQAGGYPPLNTIFRWSGTDLQYWDFENVGHETWLNARPNGLGGVEIESGGHWYELPGLTYQEVVNALGSPGSSPCTSMEEAERQEYVRQYATGFGFGVVDDYGYMSTPWGWVPVTVEATFDSMYESISGNRPYFTYDMAPKDPDAWQLAAGFSSTYLKDHFDIAGGITNADSESTTYDQQLRLVAKHDRTALVTTLGYSRVNVDEDNGAVDFDRTSLRLTGIYSLLDQPADGLNLDLLAAVGLSRMWFDDNSVLDDTDHVFLGGGFAIGRLTSIGDLSLAYVYSVSRNIDGDPEITGENDIYTHVASARYSTSLGGKCWTSLGIDWSHTCDLPSVYDPDEFTGTVKVGYTPSNWGIAVSGAHSIENDNQRQWSLGGEIFYLW